MASPPHHFRYCGVGTSISLFQPGNEIFINKYSILLASFSMIRVTLGVLSTTCSSNIYSRVSLNRFFEGGVHMYSQELAIAIVGGIQCTIKKVSKEPGKDI